MLTHYQQRKSIQTELKRKKIVKKRYKIPKKNTKNSLNFYPMDFSLKFLILFTLRLKFSKVNKTERSKAKMKEIVKLQRK